MPIAQLNRSVFRLSGEGVAAWLDGLITNNLQSEMTFAALLTPQGKIIADFFVMKDGEDLLLDTPPP
jgi:folate-binding Fe-S cluster repair protein YgfZ